MGSQLPTPLGWFSGWRCLLGLFGRWESGWMTCYTRPRRHCSTTLRHPLSWAGFLSQLSSCLFAGNGDNSESRMPSQRLLGILAPLETQSRDVRASQSQN